jgi:hypothetical protein
MSVSKEYKNYYTKRNTQIKLAYRTYVNLKEKMDNLKENMDTLTDPKDLYFCHLAQLDCVITLLPHTLNHRINEWKNDDSRAYGNYSPEPKDNYLHTVVGILNQDPEEMLQQDGYTDLEEVIKQRSKLMDKLMDKLGTQLSDEKFSPVRQRVPSFLDQYKNKINREDTTSRGR